MRSGMGPGYGRSQGNFCLVNQWGKRTNVCSGVTGFFIGVPKSPRAQNLHWVILFLVEDHDLWVRGEVFSLSLSSQTSLVLHFETSIN